MNDNTEKQQDRRLVPVFFYGKEFQVPEACTVMQAYEFAGHRFTRGCGCRAGACGACGSLYMLPDDGSIRTGLACQTQVAADMQIIQIPFFPTRKSEYVLSRLSADALQISRIYPKLLACMGCNTCTRMCPQEIDVMDCMSAIIRGDIESAAEQSMSCVMCGLCAARCPADIAPYHIMLLARRIYGKYMLSPFRYVPIRLKQIETGEFEARLNELMTSDIETLKDLYKKQQADKRII
jgi:ferredoxin